MKVIKSYESYISNDNLPDNIKLVDVLWNGFYRTYNNDLSQLSVGDYTDKGVIIKKNFKDTTSLYYSTDEGEFRANQFKVYTSNNYFDLKNFMELKNNIQKYNL